MVDLQFPIVNCESIKNTYTFTYYDENDEIIDKQVYYNVTMPKRYFVNDVTNLYLKIGTFTPNDMKRYMDGEGNFLPGYGRHACEDGAGYFTNKDGRKANPKDGWTINFPDPSPDDEQLMGTAVYTVGFNWYCTNIGSTSVSLSGESIIGYHSPDNPFNVENVMSSKNQAMVSETTVTKQVEVDGKVKTETVKGTNASVLFGIPFTDAGLFSNKGVMLSHFTCSKNYKRPVNKLKVGVDVNFTGLQFGADNFTPFTPKANILHAHGTQPNNGTCKLRPHMFGFSNFPIKNAANGGCFPIGNLIARFYVPRHEIITTDAPNDWDEEEKGPWYGLPHYEYFGNFKEGKIYKEKTVKVKKVVNGQNTVVEEQRLLLNDKEQRQIEWGNFQKETFVNYGQLGYCPIRTFVIDGYGARDVKDILPPTGTVNYMLIGEGDNTTTTFYHGITEDVGVITSGYYTLGSERKSAKSVTYFNLEDNYFHTGFLGVFDNDFHLVCSASEANSIPETGYDKMNKRIFIGLQPFTMDYYCNSRFSNSLIGSNEWLVYNKGGTIKSAWVGMNEARNYPTYVTIATASSLQDLQRGMIYRITNRESQHPATPLNIQSQGYIAIKGNDLWSMNGGYVGGFRYSSYEPPSLRFSTEEDMPGYIRFEEAPPRGAKIYINVNFKVPFFGPFTRLQGRCVNIYGNEELNGNDKKN